jgi:hypothetical protein
MENLIFNPATAPKVKCSLKHYVEVRENGFLIKKEKGWEQK